MPRLAPLKTSSRTIALAATLCLSGAAFAADERPEWLPEGSLGTGLPMLADPGGLRAALWERGVKYQLNYIGDLLNNTRGGMRRGAAYSGRLKLVVDADLEKGAGWSGAAAHANVYQIHGSGLTRSFVGNLMPVSNVEALPATRLYEAWLEQKFLDGKVALRGGQLGADTEFITSSYAGLFINGTFGWPTITAANLPGGGPAYPLATPGLRVGVYPTDKITVLVALFNGDPANPKADDPQVDNRHGLNFRVSDPAFAISEAQFKYGDEKDPKGLSGVAKLGAWTHFGRFEDQRYDALGLSLANPASSGDPRSLRGNRGVYGVLEQQVYRLADDPAKGVGVFARVAGAPNDRNLVNFYADAGVNFSGMIASRPDDSFGVAFAYARISGEVRGLDQDVVRYSGVAAPLRSSEALIEATYSAQIVPGWTLQPNLQYIMRPNGGVDPRDPSRSLPNAMVVGVRTSLKF